MTADPTPIEVDTYHCPAQTNASCCDSRSRVDRRAVSRHTLPTTLGADCTRATHPLRTQPSHGF